MKVQKERLWLTLPKSLVQKLREDSNESGLSISTLVMIRFNEQKCHDKLDERTQDENSENQG